MYKLPNKQLWTGRIDSDTDSDSFRFHQTVRCLTSDELTDKESGFSLIGFESEEGVRRNKGRLGAAKAPDEIKKALSSLPYNMEGSSTVVDIGNVVCEGENLEQAQQELGDQIESLLKKSFSPIILGGGHETLYGHYQGVRQYIGKEATLGLINIDAHFDIRDAKDPSSGTMFRQILESDSNAGYLVLGIQPFGNTKALFKKADELGCQYVLAEALSLHAFSETSAVIDRFCHQYDHILLTLCTDSIAASSAPGVSAPSPLGLDPLVVSQLLRYVASKENFVSFDISEVNPEFDIQEKTVKLAAYFIAEVMASFTRKGVEQ